MSTNSCGDLERGYSHPTGRSIEPQQGSVAHPTHPQQWLSLNSTAHTILIIKFHSTPLQALYAFDSYSIPLDPQSSQ